MREIGCVHTAALLLAHSREYGLRRPKPEWPAGRAWSGLRLSRLASAAVYSWEILYVIFFAGE
jgi:hypothetical protein